VKRGLPLAGAVGRRPINRGSLSAAPIQISQVQPPAPVNREVIRLGRQPMAVWADPERAGEVLGQENS